MKKSLAFSRLLLSFLVLGSLFGARVSALAVTSTWTGGTSTNWSTAGNWNNGVPTSTDTAVINDTSTSRTIYYDTSASGLLNILSLTQSTTGVTNTLQILRTSLQVTNSFTLGGGVSNAVSQFFIDPSQNQHTTTGINPTVTIGATGTGTLTITNGGLLTLGSYAYSSVAGSTTNWTTYVSTLKGNVLVNGGSLILPAPVDSNTTNGGTTYITTGIGSTQSTINGALTMTSGTIGANYGDANEGTRLAVSGNINITGGTLLNGGAAGGGALVMNGATNVITGIGSTGLTMFLFGDGNQSLTSDASLGAVVLRINSSNVTSVKTLNLSGTINQLQFGISNPGPADTGSTITAKLANNLVMTNAPIDSYGYASSTNTFNMDLNGYNMTALGSWTPNNVSGIPTGIANWDVLDSSTTNSTFAAASFNLSTSQSVSVGANVTLQGTGTGTNILSGGGALDPTSRFLYNVSYGNGYLQSTRAVGRVEVGDGAGVSILTLTGTSLIAAGEVKVNAYSTLDLRSAALYLTNSASLQGNGTIYASGSGNSVKFLTGATGGIQPGGIANVSASANGSVGTLTLNNGSATTPEVVLASTSLSTFDIASASSFDIFTVNGAMIDYGNSSLYLNFLSGYNPSGTNTFSIFEGLGTVTNTFSSITGSLAGDTYSFNAASGILTVYSAVPEPTPFLLIVMGLGLGYVVRRLRRREAIA